MKSQNPEKALVFDSGTLISFTMNGITDILERLRGIFNGKFLITEDVRREVVDNPMKIKRFELEALKIKALIDSKVIEMPSSLGISDKEVAQKTSKTLEIANSMYSGNGRDIRVIDYGEASCLALSKILSERGIDSTIAVDERTTRMLGERPGNLDRLLERRLHVKITLKKADYGFFKGFKFIRSAELVFVAYKKGLAGLKNGNVLDALLYGVKTKGCAISDEEISEMKKMA